ARDQSSLVPLRMLKAALDNARVEKGRSGEPLSDEDILSVVRRLVKQRKDAAEQFSAVGALGRAEEERQEADLLSSFLPPSMDDGTILDVVRSVAAETGAKGPSDLGRVMGRTMAQLKGKAEGERIRGIAARFLDTL
ncbi:MAG TPA: GatB/YqeY domain-containing protein, partial [Thermovirgaceae bacterium]|nr:GatB/YqeY domain-containing protein [Thermovirgaceae bacterium]